MRHPSLTMCPGHLQGKLLNSKARTFTAERMAEPLTTKRRISLQSENQNRQKVKFLLSPTHERCQRCSQNAVPYFCAWIRGGLTYCGLQCMGHAATECQAAQYPRNCRFLTEICRQSPRDHRMASESIYTELLNRLPGIPDAPLTVGHRTSSSSIQYIKLPNPPPLSITGASCLLPEFRLAVSDLHCPNYLFCATY